MAGVTVTKVVFVDDDNIKIDGEVMQLKALKGLDVYLVKESCESVKKQNAKKQNVKQDQIAQDAATGAQAAKQEGGKKKKTKAPKKK